MRLPIKRPDCTTSPVTATSNRTTRTIRGFSCSTPHCAPATSSARHRLESKGRPLVFLDACTSAGADVSLIGIGGWSKRFVDSGRHGVYWLAVGGQRQPGRRLRRGLLQPGDHNQGIAGPGVLRGTQDRQGKRPRQPDLAGLRSVRAPERYSHSRFLTFAGGRRRTETADREPLVVPSACTAVRRPPFIIHHSSFIVMTTPMRRQYLAIKKQFPDTILFFRLGRLLRDLRRRRQDRIRGLRCGADLPPRRRG